MKYTFLLLFVAFGSSVYAGGTVGGGGSGIVATMELMRVAVGQLPKVYANEEDLRRAHARLEVTGTETVDLKLDGETIQVRKLGNSVVDDKVSKEILSK